LNQDELYEEIDNKQGFTQEYFGVSPLKFSVMLFVVLGFGVYLGLVLYGTNSLEVLFGLEEYEQYLQSEIHRLKDENAELQREYFELKEITAQ